MSPTVGGLYLGIAKHNWRFEFVRLPTLSLLPRSSTVHVAHPGCSILHFARNHKGPMTTRMRASGSQGVRPQGGG
jgi:hypothetical protein